MITISYIDPGVGLLAWQALVAFVVGLLFYVKKTRDWIVQAFRRLLRPGKQPERSPATVSPPRDILRQ